MPPKKVKEAGPAGVRKYSEKMKMVTTNSVIRLKLTKTEQNVRKTSGDPRG